MSHLEVSINDGIATLTMNRPEARNALSMDMRSELCSALHDVEIDASVRCVVLKGAGDHFMAGGDIKGMGETIKKPARCAQRIPTSYSRPAPHYVRHAPHAETNHS